MADIVKKAVPKKPAVKPAHPSYAVMIATAIKALKERGGSSRQAIMKYILANNKIADAEKAKVRAKLASGSYWLPRNSSLSRDPSSWPRKNKIEIFDLNNIFILICF